MKRLVLTLALPTGAIYNSFALAGCEKAIVTHVWHFLRDNGAATAIMTGDSISALWMVHSLNGRWLTGTMMSSLLGQHQLHLFGLVSAGNFVNHHWGRWQRDSSRSFS